MHDLCLEVLTVNGNKLLFMSQGILHTITNDDTHLFSILRQTQAKHFYNYHFNLGILHSERRIGRRNGGMGRTREAAAVSGRSSGRTDRTTGA